MKKIKYGQLRGTEAAKFRHRFALAAVGVSFLLSVGFGYFLHLIKPELRRDYSQLANPKAYMKSIGYKAPIENQGAPVDSSKL